MEVNFKQAAFFIIVALLVMLASGFEPHQIFGCFFAAFLLLGGVFPNARWVKKSELDNEPK